MPCGLGVRLSRAVHCRQPHGVGLVVVIVTLFVLAGAVAIGIGIGLGKRAGLGSGLRTNGVATGSSERQLPLGKPRAPVSLDIQSRHIGENEYEIIVLATTKADMASLTLGVEPPDGSEARLQCAGIDQSAGTAGTEGTEGTEGSEMAARQRCACDSSSDSDAAREHSGTEWSSDFEIAEACGDLDQNVSGAARGSGVVSWTGSNMAARLHAPVRARFGFLPARSVRRLRAIVVARSSPGAIVGSAEVVGLDGARRTAAVVTYAGESLGLAPAAAQPRRVVVLPSGERIGAVEVGR
ncbi:MAG: hypothetical protein V2A73_15890 [Pseudomonadota bacterium]